MHFLFVGPKQVANYSYQWGPQELNLSASSQSVSQVSNTDLDVIDADTAELICIKIEACWHGISATFTTHTLNAE